MAYPLSLIMSGHILSWNAIVSQFCVISGITVYPVAGNPYKAR